MPQLTYKILTTWGALYWQLLTMSSLRHNPLCGRHLCMVPRVVTPFFDVFWRMAGCPFRPLCDKVTRDLVRSSHASNGMRGVIRYSGMEVYRARLKLVLQVV